MPRSVIGRLETAIVANAAVPVIPVAAGHRFRARAARRPAGFTLLEILVVVALVALISAVAAPLIFGGDEHRKLERKAGKVVDLLDTMGEQSLFLGEFLALRLHSDRIEPMRFDPVEQEFSAFVPDTPGAPRVLYLEEGMRLDWTLETPDQRDDRREGMDPGEFFREQDQAEDEGEQELPQLFFFPSGESSAARLVLESDRQAQRPFRIRLTSLGRGRIEEDEQ